MIARNPDYDAMTDLSKHKEHSSTKAPNKGSSSRHWYSIPEPVRRVFDQFPLYTYRENSIPQRAKRKSNENTLFVFANPFDTKGLYLSCNPACLKWQAYLHCNEIEFSVVASNNHASPSGSLPFLLPAISTNESAPLPLTAGKLPRWVSQQRMQEEDLHNMQHQAYMSLVDQNLRNAWLYHLYLLGENFEAVAQPLYVSTASSNRIAQAAIAYQLKQAAKSELLKSMHIVDGEDILAAAEKAFSALSSLLGSSDYYNGAKPELFDVSVFAYTHLLLDESLPWSNTALPDILSNYHRLVDHRNRILSNYLRH